MGRLSTKQVISLFVMVIIGASLVGSLADQIYRSSFISGTWANGTANDTYIATNVTGASGAILGLLTLIFVIVIIMLVVRHIRS